MGAISCFRLGANHRTHSSLLRSRTNDGTLYPNDYCVRNSWWMVRERGLLATGDVSNCFCRGGPGVWSCFGRKAGEPTWHGRGSFDHVNWWPCSATHSTWNVEGMGGQKWKTC